MASKTNIPSTVRNCVWNIYIGADQKQGVCFCCNTEQISFANFECGHVQAKTKNGDTTIQNLRPICGLCNKSMGTQNMEEFMAKYGFVKSKNWNGINNTVMNNSPKYDYINNNYDQVITISKIFEFLLAVEEKNEYSEKYDIFCYFLVNFIEMFFTSPNTICNAYIIKTL